jgi:hypothetical protein
MILQLTITIFLLLVGGIECNDNGILEEISKCEKRFYTNKIQPKSFGRSVDRNSYKSIINRKTTLREQVLSELKKEKSDFRLKSLGSFFLAEGADGAYAYGYIWNDTVLIRYSYDPVSRELFVSKSNKYPFFDAPDGYFFNEVSKWDDELKKRPIWSNPSLMGGLCFFVSKIDIDTSNLCRVETLGLYEFKGSEM